MQPVQRQFSSAVLDSSGFPGVLLSHWEFPNPSAKLPFFRLILKYPWDAACSPLMLSFQTVIIKTINDKRNNLGSIYWQEEQ